MTALELVGAIAIALGALWGLLTAISMLVGHILRRKRAQRAAEADKTDLEARLMELVIEIDDKTDTIATIAADSDYIRRNMQGRGKR